ncbi:MAG: manganese efflux pump [Clostridiales bacterium]|nr:manganese efflux pump [Clostridiales bacterium]
MDFFLNTEVTIGIPLILNSLLLGVGLAMDAFSVSIANGLEEPSMKKARVCAIAGIYALFQFAMPLAGWFFVHSVAELFKAFQPFIPWIALILLCFIGGKMIFEGVTKKTQGDKQEEEKVSEHGKLTAAVLLVQGLATSIDALSVGFTISEYKVSEALLSSAIIGAVTFAICVAGLVFGKKIGERFSDKATVIGGIILIFIGFEILIKSFI